MLTASSLSASVSTFSAQLSLSSGGARRPAPATGPVVPAAPHSTPASAAGDDSDLFDRLSDIDPAFGKNAQALLAFIEKSDPEAAAQFRKLLQFGADAHDSSKTAAAAPANPGTPGGTRTQRIEVALQASVTEIQMQLNDGTQVTARQIDVAFSAQFTQELGQSDPLVLDLNGNGTFDTTTAQGGNYFDLAASGRRVRAATAAAGDGLLVFDRNGNGRIDDGTELFGDQNGRADGFAELGQYDQNGDGWVDAADPVFQNLGVWQDANLNGETDGGELRSLTDLHIARIAVAAQASSEASSGNAVVKAGTFVRDDGSQGRAGDLLLNYVV